MEHIYGLQKRTMPTFLFWWLLPGDVSLQPCFRFYHPVLFCCFAGCLSAACLRGNVTAVILNVLIRVSNKQPAWSFCLFYHRCFLLIYLHCYPIWVLPLSYGSARGEWNLKKLICKKQKTSNEKLWEINLTLFFYNLKLILRYWQKKSYK